MIASAWERRVRMVRIAERVVGALSVEDGPSEEIA
jgi:hypothetical protein